MTITPATTEDAAEVSALLAELGYSVSVENAATRLTQLATTGNDPVFLFRHDGRALGLLVLHRAPSITYPGGMLRITALVVVENARGQGIGRALVAHAMGLAQQSGCELVELTSGMDRTDAHAFYRALGFETTSLRFRLKVSS